MLQRLYRRLLEHPLILCECKNLNRVNEITQCFFLSHMTVGSLIVTCASSTFDYAPILCVDQCRLVQESTFQLKKGEMCLYPFFRLFL